jgi:hypothetical protein
MDTKYLELRAPTPDLLLKMPITLPIAIHKAGIWLTKFAIKMSSVDLSLLSMSADEETGLQAAMQRLTSFDFLPDDWSCDSESKRSETDIEHLRKYLTAIIDTDTLEDLSLDFETHWNLSILPGFNMGTLLSFRS